MTPQPLFLLSLPRSGSTLVQRVLATHPEVATAAEPWVALPQLYATLGRGVYAEYGYGPSTRAIREFAEALPGRRDAYDEEVRAFLLRVYGLAGGDATYFLDKTPRYHLVAGELLTLCPTPRRSCCGATRSPSSRRSSRRGQADGGRSAAGTSTCTRASTTSCGPPRSTQARPRSAIRGPGRAARRTWPDVFAYLGLAYDPAVLSAFSETRLDARMGDPSGSRDYDRLSTDPSPSGGGRSQRYRKAWGGGISSGSAASGSPRWVRPGAAAGRAGRVPSGPRLLLSDTWRGAYGRATQGRRDRALRRLTKRGRW